MMKKKILTIVTGAMLTASVGFAAPITDLEHNESTIGYNHYNLHVNGIHMDTDSFYLEHGITDKVIVGLERNSYSVPVYDDRTTDIYAHYKVDQNVRFILGNRDYSSGPSKMFYGIGASTNLTPNVDGYASVTSSSIATEWQTGVTYKLNDQASLHLGYKSYKEDGAPNADGIGFGANYKF
jgi:opacity protein-like surface antigen